METTRVKWDESMLKRGFSVYNLVRPKASTPAYIKESKISVEPILELEDLEKDVEDSDKWKDFANDIDWAMM